MKRRSFLRAAAVPVLCAAALLGPPRASATVESAPSRGANAQVAEVLTAALPAVKVISARRLAASQRLPEHVDRLHRAALALCGSSHDAEDLVQETFARVLARPRRLRRDDELPYMLAALRNTYLTGVRTRGRRPQTVELPAEASEIMRSSRAEPEAAFEQRELLATIAALPPDFRDALVAVDLVGLSYGEAGRLLGVREATITTRVYRARKRVAHTLAGK
jgi:RNA polymerase sigma-70 factor, ECF subfamily